MKNKDFLGIFEEELFAPGLAAADKQDSLSQLVDYLFARKRVNNRQAVLTTLLEREKLGSTGIGKGVAIPHSRSMMVDRLTVLPGSFPDGVDFDAIDKKPVHLVFLILAPPQDIGNQYLPFIGKLVEVIKEKKHREALRGARDPKEFLGLMEKAL